MSIPQPAVSPAPSSVGQQTVFLGAPAPVRQDVPVTHFGHYEVQELIGRGSFGEVYRALDRRLGREVAIKLADRRFVEDPALRALFLNEARIQARLEHANIVPIYDLVETPDRLAMVMRLIHGEDLDKRLEKMVRPLRPLEGHRLLGHVSSALGAAHDRGVIHQDLKPGNIRLTASGEAVVLDFGVARLAGELDPQGHGAGGTPAYMSPEQVAGGPVDARSDLYALAMTLYKVLTGHHPFETARSVQELLLWQLEREPSSPADFNRDLPGPLCEVLLRGLAKDPRARYRSCEDFARAVSVALGLEEASAAEDGRWHPRARVGLVAEVLMADGSARPARIRDLSVAGASLQVAGPLSEGSRAELVIHIPLTRSEHLVRCAMTVMRAVPEGDDGTVRAGVQFRALGAFDRAVLGDLVRAVLVRD